MVKVVVSGTELTLEDWEINEQFMCAAGPGGQNVNSVATAARLRFDVRNSPSLPEAVRERLTRIAGRRLTAEGVLIITARQHRTQGRNRAAALAQLFALISQAAAEPPPKRRATRPTGAAIRRRLESKRRRAHLKRNRGSPGSDAVEA